MHRTFAVLALAGLLAACGTNQTDRAITGGALGAAAGALAAGFAERDLASGVIVGGAIGAAAGALTDAEDFDLGEPIYRRNY